MFALVRTEKAVFTWLRADGGDAALLLSASPAPWEAGILWVVRAEKLELLRVVRQYERLKRSRQVIGICWHAGHSLTAQLGEQFADFGCGKKFLLMGWDRSWLRKKSGPCLP